MVKELVERSIEPCRIALKDAGLTPQQVNQVLLVGGMTRMPAIQKKV
ncbi:MAG: Hsp70 family protein, partial [Myxococcaceae bacterium]|nr:Hsp70 family protein [Myxococcaceae bacterium]